MKLYFIHGAGSTAQVWDKQIEHFPGSEAVSLPGHPVGPGMSTVPDYANWLRGQIDPQGERVPVVVGHSMGGGIAIQYALQFPERLKALVLVSTGARLRVSPQIFGELEKGVEAATDFVLRWAFSKHAAPGMIANARLERLKVSAETVRGDFKSCDSFDATQELGKIAVPTLILCGTDDVMTPTKYAGFLHSHIPGSVLRIIPDAGHMVMIEQPEAVDSAIKEFLTSVGASS